jgi:hypothetical protein
MADLATMREANYRVGHPNGRHCGNCEYYRPWGDPKHAACTKVAGAILFRMICDWYVEDEDWRAEGELNEVPGETEASDAQGV